MSALSTLLASRPRWISLEERHPPRNTTVIYMVEPTLGAEPYPAVADEWRDEHHGKDAIAWLENQ